MVYFLIGTVQVKYHRKPLDCCHLTFTCFPHDFHSSDSGIILAGIRISTNTCSVGYGLLSICIDMRVLA